MGRPKQLLRYRGQTLLRRMAEMALALPLHETVVVLGHAPDQMTPELHGLPLRTAHNPDWASGMGSSVATGMAALPQGVSAVLMLLVDQPRVTPALAERIIHGYQIGHDLVVADYGETIGVPALFGRRFFDQLAGLATQGGARQILRAHAAEALRIPFPGGLFDLDTPEDYQRLLAEGDDT